MRISAVRLYHPAPWGWLYSYRATLVTLRMAELTFITTRFIFFRGPLLIAWTRLPGLRGIRPPYGELGRILAPFESRASLEMGGGQLGSNLMVAKSSEDVSQLRNAILGQAKTPPRFWSVFGCFLRGLLTELGSSFLKFGQIMSMREEIPPTVRNELQLLQDKLPAMSFKEVKRILERELDRPVEEIFEYVEEKPLAAASLAQVHAAKLRKEQTEVALKVQRRYLEGIVALDTVIICDIVFRVIEIALPLLKKSTDVTVLTSSYRKSLKMEIDFVTEERNQSRWRNLAENHPIYSKCIKVANTYKEYTTTKLLTMELVKDYHRMDRIFDEFTPEEIWEVASIQLEEFPPEMPFHMLVGALSVVAEGCLHWGFSHGDYHLGNIYLLRPNKEKGETWKCFICDFGMMLDLSKEQADEFREVICGIMYAWDGKRTADIFSKLSEKQGKKIEGRAREMLELNLTTGINRGAVEMLPGCERVFLNKSQARGTSTNTMGDIIYRVAAGGVKFPDYFWLVLKGMSNIQNISLTSGGTTYDWNELMTRHAKKWLKDKVMKELEGRDVVNALDSLPEILSVLREHDRKEILKSLYAGEEVKPLAKVHSQIDVNVDIRSELLKGAQ